MKTAKEFEEVLASGREIAFDDLRDAVDCLALRESQVARLCEAGKEALGDLGGIEHDNGLFEYGTMVENVDDDQKLDREKTERLYREKERIESKLRAAIAAVEGEGARE